MHGVYEAKLLAENLDHKHREKFLPILEEKIVFPWKPEEKQKFMTALQKHGKNYAKISEDVGSKDYKAILNACHLLKQKLSKTKNDEESSTILAELQKPLVKRWTE